MFRPTRVWVLLVVSTAIVSADGARAQAFEATAHATLLHTGNSLSLSGQTSANGPGTATSGHTLICLDTTEVDDIPVNAGNPWFPGTTNAYTLDGSAGILDLPSQSNVLHAEVIWSGSFRYGPEDLSSVLDQAVTLTTPAGRSFAIVPDPGFSHTLDFTSLGIPIAFYVRGAVVTDRVAAAGGGTYELRSVPVTQHETVNSLNGGGWSLIVVSERSQAPCRSVALQTLGGWVDENNAVTAIFSNLATPASGAIVGRALLGATAGDATLSGDAVAILMPGTSTYLPLSGPNNPETNFFASQINDRDGVLDTGGTFGTRNHDAIGQTQVPGGRQGWDLTAVALDSASGHLAPSETEATLRFISNGDGYVAVFAGFEADSVGPCSPPGNGIFSDGFESGDEDAWSRFFL